MVKDSIVLILRLLNSVKNFKKVSPIQNVLIKKNNFFEKNGKLMQILQTVNKKKYLQIV